MFERWAAEDVADEPEWDVDQLDQIAFKYDDVRAWLARTIVHHDVLISEVADYELRRELLRIASHRMRASSWPPRRQRTVISTAEAAGTGSVTVLPE